MFGLNSFSWTQCSYAPSANTHPHLKDYRYISILTHLQEAAKRYFGFLLGQKDPTVLWTDPFLSAICHLCRPQLYDAMESFESPTFLWAHADLARNAPVLGIILMDFGDWKAPANGQVLSYRRRVIDFACNTLLSTLPNGIYDTLLSTETNDLIDDLISSQSKSVLQSIDVLLVAQLWPERGPLRRTFVATGLWVMFAHGSCSAYNDLDLGRRIIVHRVLGSLIRCFLRTRTIPLITVSHALDSLIDLYRRYASESCYDSRLLSEWLLFILEEINHASGSSARDGTLGVRDNEHSWKAYLNSIVNLVFVLTDWIRSFQHIQSDIRWPHYVTPPRDPLGNSPRTRCFSLCSFQYVVIQSLATVHSQRPDLRLDKQSWRRLRETLTDNANDSLANVRRAMCSTLAHRNEVRLVVLDAFAPFSPNNPGEPIYRFNPCQHVIILGSLTKALTSTQDHPASGMTSRSTCPGSGLKLRLGLKLFLSTMSTSFLLTLPLSVLRRAACKPFRHDARRVWLIGSRSAPERWMLLLVKLRFSS